MTVIPGLKNQKGDVTITIQRNHRNDKCTFGEYSINGNTFYTLEPSPKAEHPCIPAGKYPVRIAHSPKRNEQVIWIDNVPGRTYIQIHPGNFPKDTQGCILPGRSYKICQILDSRISFEHLINFVRDLIVSGIKVYVEIKD